MYREGNGSEVTKTLKKEIKKKRSKKKKTLHIYKFVYIYHYNRIIRNGNEALKEVGIYIT